MKKFIISALMALSCGVLFAEDTDMYLFWMIDSGATFDGQKGLDLTGYTARLSDGQKYLNLYADVGVSIGDYDSAKNVQQYDTLAGIGGYSDGSSFFVELLSGGTLAYTSETMGYGDLGAYMSSMKGMAQPADTYGFKSFTASAVPEPTSGLLLLLGVAGLALRRKNKKA